MRKCKTILCIGLAVAMLAAFSGCKSQDEIANIREGQQAAKTTQEIVIKQETAREIHVITVVGEGEVEVEPSEAKLYLSMHAQAQSAEEAKEHVNTLTQELMEALKQAGVSDDAIKTQEIIVVPRNDQSKNPPEILEYIASGSFAITIKNTKRMGETIDAAVSAGAVIEMPIEYYIADEKTAYQQALSLAVEDAYAKSEIMAQTSGMSIEGALNIREEKDENEDEPNTLLYEAPTQTVKKESGNEEEEQEEEKPAATLVSVGKLKVRAKVSAEFSVKWP